MDWFVEQVIGTEGLMPLFRGIVLALVAVPLLGAAVVAASGRSARRVALSLAVIELGLAGALVGVGAWPVLAERGPNTKADAPYFEPLFVPGAISGAADRTSWTLMSLAATPTTEIGPHVQFYLGIDGLNVWLVVLCAVMLIPVILVSWDAVTDRPASFYAWLLVLQGAAVGAFLSFDAILFYVFFELTLIPAFFLIGRWGTGSARREAARKFFLYTLAGSLLTLVGVVGIALTNPVPLHPVSGKPCNDAVVEVRLNPATGEMLPPGTPDGSQPGEYRFTRATRGPVTFSIPALMANVHYWSEGWRSAQLKVKQTEDSLRNARRSGERASIATEEQRVRAAKEYLAEAEREHHKNRDRQFWLFVVLIAGFLVKVPVWPFHTWLPAAYAEAPLGVTVFLSAILAKLGTFGILRLVLPLTPDAAIEYGLPAVGTLAAIGIIYGSLCAFAQRDMRLMIAYSSIAHLGFLVLGLFAFNAEGLSGATLHMVNHGVSTGALFALLAFFLARYRTTDMRQFGGLMGRFPGLAFLAFVLVLASIGLPGLNNFVSEMLMLGGLIHDTAPGTTATRPRSVGLAVVAAIGIFLSAWYMLTMVQAVFFNPHREPPAATADPPGDVSGHEAFTLGSLAVLCLALGLFPQVLLTAMKGDVGTLTATGNAARLRAQNAPPDYAPDIPVSKVDPNVPKTKGPGPGKKPGDVPPKKKSDGPPRKKDVGGKGAGKAPPEEE